MKSNPFHYLGCLSYDKVVAQHISHITMLMLIETQLCDASHIMHVMIEHEYGVDLNVSVISLSLL